MMYNLKNYKSPPRLLGYILCALLILSRFWSASQNDGKRPLNTILVIAILCLSMHLIRRTGELFYPHVWNDPRALILLVMPAANLIITGLGLASKTLGKVFSSPVCLGLLTVLSTPVFLTGYFLYLTKKLPYSFPLKVVALSLTAVCAVYVVTRICDIAVFPALQNAGKAVPEALMALSARNSSLSLLIFIGSIGAFFLAGRSVKEYKETETTENES